MPSARRGSFHTGGDTFADQRRLKFGHGADDGEHGAAHRAIGVDLILDADKADAKMVEFLQGRQQVLRDRQRMTAWDRNQPFRFTQRMTPVAQRLVSART